MLSAALPKAIARGLLWHHSQKLERFKQQLASAPHVQHQVLFEKIRRCQFSQFGRDHGFSSIRSLKDFRSQVPIAGHEYIDPYVQQVVEGNATALFATWDKVLMFAQTSGTTGKSKFIPITRSALRDFKRGWQLWGIRAFLDHPSLVLADILNIVGNCELRRTPMGVPIGMASGLYARCQNPFIRRYYVLPSIMSEISDPTAKYYSMLRLSIVRSVGLVTTAIPAALVRLAKMSNDFCETLIRDIADGTLSRDFDVPARVRRGIQSRISKPNRQRASELESIVKRTGTLYPKDYWNVSLLGCWLGGTVGVQSELLGKYYGDAPRRDIGIVASEGRFTVPLEDALTSGVLDIAGNYYEFIPVDEIDSSQPTVLEGHELRPDCDYYLLITTSSGLYRYNMFDVVRCTGFDGLAPLLRFLNKGQHISDLEGEKVTEYQVVQAVADAARRLSLAIAFFTVVPVRCRDQEPHYVVMLEESVIAGGDLERRFLSVFDECLSQQNFAYKVRRDDGYLAPPRLVRTADNSWAKCTRAEVARRGVSDDQYKHPYLVLDSSFLDRFERAGAVHRYDSAPSLSPFYAPWSMRPGCPATPTSEHAAES
jgi:hypothetical protein